mmetsp:Transcript_54153/g.155581  ORF Transcript_54153/g.155581 Transcript_54153/m.155581 type:complete len:201 (+) Transcript_54153:2207-2809(+)
MSIQGLGDEELAQQCGQEPCGDRATLHTHLARLLVELLHDLPEAREVQTPEMLERDQLLGCGVQQPLQLREFLLGERPILARAPVRLVQGVKQRAELQVGETVDLGQLVLQQPVEPRVGRSVDSGQGSPGLPEGLVDLPQFRAVRQRLSLRLHDDCDGLLEHIVGDAMVQMRGVCKPLDLLAELHGRECASSEPRPRRPR